MPFNQTCWDLGPGASWWPLANASSSHSAPPTGCSYRAELIDTNTPTALWAGPPTLLRTGFVLPKQPGNSVIRCPSSPPRQPDSCDRNQMLRKGLNPPSRQLQNWFRKSTAALNTREKQPKRSHCGSWKKYKVVLGACLLLRGHACPEKVGVVSLLYKL